MRTPSSAFAKLFDFILYDGIKDLTLSSSGTVFEISNLSAVLTSNEGKHFVKTIDKKIQVDLSSVDNGDYVAYLSIAFNANDTETSTYVLDSLNIDFLLNTDEQPGNSIKIATLTKNDDDITNIIDVSKKIDNPMYADKVFTDERFADRYTKNESDLLLDKKADKAQDYDTETTYKDKEDDTLYKLYVDNGDIVLEEV